MSNKPAKTKFKFEEDSCFAPEVKSAYSEDHKETFYWVNGTADQHSMFGAQVADEKTRQQGLERAMFNMAVNEDGSYRYKGRLLQTDFHKRIDRVKARDFGMLILGYKKGDLKSEFEQETEDEVKNSETASESLTD